MTEIFMFYATINELASELKEIVKTHRIVQVVNDRQSDELATWWIVIAETTEAEGGEA